MTKKSLTLAICMGLALSLAAGLVTKNAAYAQQEIKAGPLQLSPADIVVTVTAYDQETGKVIADGSSNPYSGGAPSNNIKFTVSNKGGQKAENFTFKMVVRRDGLKIYDPPAEKLTLNPGETKTFPMVKVNLPGTSNQVEASILGDIGNFVKESNETNNKASVSYKASVVH